MLVLRPCASYVGGGDWDLERIDQSIHALEKLTGEDKPFAFRRNEIIESEFTVYLF